MNTRSNIRSVFRLAADIIVVAGYVTAGALGGAIGGAFFAMVQPTPEEAVATSWHFTLFSILVAAVLGVRRCMNDKR